MTNDAGPWLNATMTCAVCSHEWVATYPDEAPALECPACGYMNLPPEAQNDDDIEGT